MKGHSALRPIVSMWEWQESAACRDGDVSWFYSPTHERGLAKETRERKARQICSGCPVRVECARFALALGERWGVWGGMTDRERAAMLRQPRPAESGVKVRDRASAPDQP